MARWLKWLLPFAAFLLVFGAARFDAWLYRAPIVQVTTIQTAPKVAHTDNYGNKDWTREQTLHAHFLNTKQQGKTVKLSNSYSQSGAQDSKITVGSQLFVTRNGHSWQVNNRKRDGVVLALAAFAFVLLGLIMRKRFWLTASSLLLNAVVFWVAVHIEIASHQTLAFALFSLVAVIFTIITTLFVVGFKPLALVVGGAAVIATALAVALGYGIFAVTGYKDLHLEAVQYVTQAPQLLFFTQIIIGSLGAVLDECSDIAVSIFQMDEGPLPRFKAGMAIGRNVMGPLIAVLFMIFIADTFAEAVLWLRNGNSISQTVDWVMGLGFAQSLISAFGIVLATPLTSGLAALFAKKVRA